MKISQTKRKTMMMMKPSDPFSAARPGRAGMWACLLAVAVFAAVRAESLADAESSYLQAVELYKTPGGDRDRVRSWLETASAAGHLASKELLAHLLAEGDGVPKDEAAALDLLRQAAEAGSARARYNHAVMIEAGRGAASDAARALDDLRLSAESGYLPAHLKLAEYYYFGEGPVLRDYAAALPHLRAAAAARNAWAQNVLGTAFEFGHGLTADRSMARHWFEQAANQGYVKSQSNLGRMLRTGPVAGRDVVEALKWLKIAAEAGDTAAILTLEDIGGAFTPEQLREADHRVRLFKAAAGQGG